MFGVHENPLAPKKTYFLVKLQIFVKFWNFQKSRFRGPEGGVLVSNNPKWFYISIFIYFGGLEAKKGSFSKISVAEKCDFLSFQGPCGAPLRIFLAKNGSKSSVPPLIEKSLPFGPIKIAFKMSYWRFSFFPPPQIGLINFKNLCCRVNHYILLWLKV